MDEIEDMLNFLQQKYTDHDYQIALFLAKDVLCNYIRNYCDETYKMAGE